MNNLLIFLCLVVLMAVTSIIAALVVGAGVRFYNELTYYCAALYHSDMTYIEFYNYIHGGHHTKELIDTWDWLLNNEHEIAKRILKWSILHK